jgi:HTH-type transcriptional regulator/antitoxin MqsA
MNNLVCADCGGNTLQAFTEAEQFDYKGHTLTVDVEYSVCSQCEAETIFPDQIKRNDCRARDAWRKADGLLTGAEIVVLRKQLGLTQQQAAQLFGGGTNAFSKYERGEVTQSVAMDKLMRLAMEKQPVCVPDWLGHHAGLTIRNLEATPNGYDKNVIPFRPKLPRQSVQTKYPEHSAATEYQENYQDLGHG